MKLTNELQKECQAAKRPQQESSAEWQAFSVQDKHLLRRLLNHYIAQGVFGLAFYLLKEEVEYLFTWRVACLWNRVV